MLTYPEFNPVALKLGLLNIYWYGLLYLLGFLLAGALSYWRGQRQVPPWSADDILDLAFYFALGVILGGRLGFVLVYGTPFEWWRTPWTLLAFWEPGRSFHGGLIGVLVAMAFFARKHQRAWLEVLDFIAPVVPIGIILGRLGNFINGELWGRVTLQPWGMVFPHVGPEARHPSQLYELFLEGVVLGIVLWVYARVPRPRGAVSGLFLVGYGLARIAVEYFREPDLQVGTVAFGWLTMGQLLSLPMIAVGLFLMWRHHQRTH